MHIAELRKLLYLCSVFSILIFMHMKKEQFLQLYQDQQRSGLTGKSYCITHGLSVSNFYYWKKKFIDSVIASGSSKGDLIPISVQSAHTPGALSSGVSIHLPNGIDVEFGSSDDKVALQMLTTICTRYV